MDKNIKATTLGTLHKDLFFNKKVSISFDSVLNDIDTEYKVLVQIEPPTITNITDTIIDNQNKFDLILSWNKKILDNCPNSVLFPFGSCWIGEEYQKIHNKTKLLSIIASSKNTSPGHKLRHNLINEIGINVDLFGNGYNQIENKITALKDYMFSIVIENEKIDNWFTEKIIDCLITGTIPIYWGCSNIGNYFDERGFIIFNDLDEFKRKISLINETTYFNMLPYIEYNYNLSKNYFDFWSRVELEINKKI
jgi:hypothetical protein